MYILGAGLPIVMLAAGAALIVGGFADHRDGLSVAGAILVGAVFIGFSYSDRGARS